LEGNKAVSPMS